MSDEWGMRLLGLLLAAGGLAAGGAAIWQLVVLRRRRLRPRQIEIARIEEHSQLTVGGAFAAILLALHNLLMLRVVIGGGSVRDGLLWLGGNLLFGLGIAIGRRRSYRVLRAAEPVEREKV